MSVLRFNKDLQIWNNEAFDNIGESDDNNFKPSSSFLDFSDSLHPSKENRNPSLISSPIYLNQNVSKPISNSDQRNIDLVIAEMEKEISRLTSKLEKLRMEKAKGSVKAVEKRVRIVPAKFMEKSCGFGRVRGEELGKMIGEGRTLGPRFGRRGMSLGPAEIYSETSNSMKFGKQELGTPIQGQNIRRKSCFWKLAEIDEVKAIKQRGKSLSPKSRKVVSTPPAWKSGAVTTVGTRKFVKKEDGIVSLVQPKNLFADGEKSGPCGKKSLRNGRIVASRYSQTNGGSVVKDVRKKALPENDKEEGKKCDSKRVSFSGKSTDSQVKRSSEVMREVTTTIVEKTPVSVSKMLEFVPKIKTKHYVNDSPRDSGAAKRVSELIGKRSYFSLANDDDEEDPSVYQTFSETLSCIGENRCDYGAVKRVPDLMGKYNEDDVDDWKNSLFQTLHFA